MRNGLRAWALGWSLLGCAAFALLPWYAVAEGLVAGGWLPRVFSDRDLAPALVM
jgi:hypothetical protein